MIETNELKLTESDYDKALTEIGFLLEVLTSTIHQVIGQSAPSMGVSSGRQMGKKLPIYLRQPTLETVLGELCHHFDAGFAMTFKCDADGADIAVGACAIRDVCANRGSAAGKDVCTMFHYYLSGMCAELLGRPVRPAPGKLIAGPTCAFRLDAK